MEHLGLDPEPAWIKGIDTGVAGQEDMHISGQMRELSDDIYRHDQDNSASILLGEAADRLDDAHEQWMEDQL